MSITTHLQLNHSHKDDLMSVSPVSSTVSYVDDGCFGPAAVFSGSEAIEYDLHNSYLGDPTLTSSLSVACRVRSATTGVGYVLSTGGQTTSSIGLAIRFNAGELVVNLKTRTRMWTITYPSIAVDVDYAIVFVWDSEVLSLYLNGVLVATDTTPSSHSTFNDSNTLTIGKPNNVNNYYYVGLVSDVRFYNHALSITEITSYSHGLVLDLDLGAAVVDVNGVKIADRSRLANPVNAPSPTTLVKSTPTTGRSGLTFQDNKVSIPHPLRSGSFTWSVWCNFDRNNPLVDERLSGGVNYYAVVMHLPGVLLLTVHRQNDIRLLDSNGNVLWSATADATYHLTPFTWGKWALVTITYDRHTNTLTTYHNDKKVWVKHIVLSQSYGSTAYLGDTLSPVNTMKPFIGDLGRVSVYASCLDEDNVRCLAQTHLSLSQNGHLQLPEQFSEPTDWLEGPKRQNLVFNGHGQDYSNANFGMFQFVDDPSDGPYFQITSGSIVALLDEFIPVEGDGLGSFDRYRIACDIRGDISASRFYFMIACYNRNKQWIMHQDVSMVGGTDTVLTQPLSPGDHYAYVASTDNWFDVTSGVISTYHNFCYWLNDPEPYVTYKYTRRRAVYTNLDRANHRIHFQSGWSGPTLPAGTPVMNSTNGGTYSYIGASNHVTELGTWLHREGLSGATANVGSMRYGTSYIRVGWLLNRDVSWSRTDIRNVQCWNVNRPQNQPIGLKSMSIRGSSLLQLPYVDEVGGPDNLLHWYRLTGNTQDSVGDSDIATVAASPSPMGYRFKSTDSTYLTMAYNPFNGTLLNFTVCSWVYNTTNANESIILGNHLHGTTWETIVISDRTVIVNHAPSSVNRTRIDIVTPVGEWFHLAVVRDDANDLLLVYLNGNLLASKACTQPMWNSTVSPTIGAAKASAAPLVRQGLTGYVQQVRIYEKALDRRGIVTAMRRDNPQHRGQGHLGGSEIQASSLNEVASR